MAITKIFFIGDIVGRLGRRVVGEMLGALRSRYDIDLVVANAENAAGGSGITKKTAAELLDCGIDVISLGNHAFSKRDANFLCNEDTRILRPANMQGEVPGNGWGVFEARNGVEVGVVVVVGKTYMDPASCPFEAAEFAVIEIKKQCAIAIVDAHAEATSEKSALGWFLDGKASAVIGTHTHIQTSDERVLPNGTAYLTDAGMTGVRDSVLGLDCQMVINRFTGRSKSKFALAEGNAMVQGAIIEVDSSTGKAISVVRVSELECAD